MYKFKIRKPKRSWQNKSHEFKFDCGFGTLFPILCDDLIPNSTVRLSTELFTRFQSLISPAMQRVDARIEYFFVPNRIIYDDFEKMIDNVQDGQSYVKPYFNLSDIQSQWVENSLADYLGFPVNYTTGLSTLHESANPLYNDKVDALPFRAYYKIWYDFYRDENVMGNEPAPRTTGGQLSAVGEGNPILYLQTRCYPRDYFTSALPFAQQSAAVRLPLDYTPNGYVQFQSDKTVNVTDAGASNTGRLGVNTSSGNFSQNFQIRNLANNIQGPTVEEVRRASAVQRWLERNMRFGSRYVESVAAHFGIRVPDFRLDRPEYLGGGKVNVRISEVLSTSESENYPVGEEAGHAIAAGSSKVINYTAREHGWLIGLLSFVPKASYGQGWPRKFNRWSALDYAFPEFDNLGEQPLYNQELYAYGPDGDDVLGYKPRFDEYKHAYDRYAGQFRNTLAYWHLGRIFGQQPTLSPQFIGINYHEEVAPATDPDRLTRIFAVDEQRPIIADLYHHYYVKCPLSNNDVSTIK